MNIRKFIASDIFHQFVIYCGCVHLITAIFLSAGGFDFFLNLGIKKLFRVTKSSPMFKLWQTIPVPIYMKFYLFDIANPEEVLQGEKAVMREKGPYTYLIDFEKYSITKNSTRDTVKYKQNRTFYFQPELSNGRVGDVITMINVPFLTVAQMASQLSDVDAEEVDQLLSKRNETITRRVKVKDLLFDGISVQAYLELMKEPVVEQVGRVGFLEQFKDGKFALMKNKNGTNDGFVEVFSGIKDSSQFCKLYSIQNGKRKLDIHKGDSCNAINGSDGTFNAPFIKPGKTDLYVFVPEICKSLKWKYQLNTAMYGIDVARHILPPFESVQENPDKWCFCPKDEPSKCDVSGVESLQACFQGVPVQLTKPHFFEADRDLTVRTVKGLRIDSIEHQSKLDIHALTGATVEVQLRYQFSIEMAPWAGMPSLKNVNKAMVPIAWMEMSGRIDKLNEIALWILSMFLFVWPFLQVLSFLGAIGTICIGKMIGMSRKSRIGDKKKEEDDEPQPGKRMLTKEELEAEEKEEEAIKEIQDDSVMFITNSKKAKEE